MVDEAETVAELLERLTPYVGQVSAAGRQVIGVLCSVTKCQRWDRVSKTKHVDRDRQCREAASKFIAAGWGFREGPICPDCLSGRRPRTK